MAQRSLLALPTNAKGVALAGAGVLAAYLSFKYIFKDTEEIVSIGCNEADEAAEDDYLGIPKHKNKLKGSFEPPEHAKVVGLQNNGNTCFLNSILQALSSLRAFRVYIHEMRALAPNLELLKELEAIVNGETRDPIRLHKIIAAKERMYTGGYQQDAQELFVSLMAAIQEDAGRIEARLSRLPRKNLSKIVQRYMEKIKKKSSEQQQSNEEKQEENVGVLAPGGGRGGESADKKKEGGKRNITSVGCVPCSSSSSSSSSKSADGQATSQPCLDARCPLLPFIGATASTKECRECGYKPPVRQEEFQALPLSLASIAEMAMMVGEDGGRAAKEGQKVPSVEELLKSSVKSMELPDVICERCSGIEELRMIRKARKRQQENANSRWSHQKMRVLLEKKEKQLLRFLETGIEDVSLAGVGVSEDEIRERNLPLEPLWATKKLPSLDRLGRTAKCAIVRRELLVKLPPLLCLHLQRRYGSMKISDFVKFPLFLDMSEVVGPSLVHLRAQDTNEDNSKGGQARSSSEGGGEAAKLVEGRSNGGLSFMFALAAVIEHKGGAQSGHYVTYRRQNMLLRRRRPPRDHLKENSDNDGRGPTERAQQEQWEDAKSDILANMKRVQSSKWFFASDSAVSEVSLSRVLQSQAYLLFYERLDVGRYDLGE